MISKALTFRILLARLAATGFAVQVRDRKTKNMLANTDVGQNVAQHASRKYTGIMHPTDGTLRVFKQFAWLGVDSDRMVLSRPAHLRVSRKDHTGQAVSRWAASETGLLKKKKTPYTQLIVLNR